MAASVDDCKLILYANDSAIFFYAHRDFDIIAQNWAVFLKKCSSWFADIRLSLHSGKTESILFGSPRKLKSVTDLKKICMMVMLLKVLTVSNT